MNKTLKLLLLTIFIFSISSCDDEFANIYESSRVEKFDSHILSVFRIPHVHSSSTTTSYVDIIQVNGDYVNRLQADITKINDTESEVGLTIPNEANLTDGTYIIKVDSISDRFIAKAEDNLITIIEINNGNYLELESSESNGSRTHPFLINSNDKFNKFIYALSKDNYHGAGFYFKQTAFIQWSNNEQNLGEGLASQSFAGNYDGDNYILSNVVINGKNEAGIFKQLINGATISNLIINNISISNVEKSGVIAGSAQNTVKLSNINVTGNISGTNNVGGLIGSCTDGYIYIDNITMGASISGGQNIGGAIGYLNCYCSINKFMTASSFRVGNENVSISNNAQNVGGVIGFIDNHEFNISNTEILHTSSIDDNAQVITGDENVGGLIGKILNLNDPQSTIDNCRVISPISANNYGGGFIGYAEIGHKLSITNSQSCIITKQGNYIGGFIGYLEYNDEDLLTFSNNNVVASDNSEIQLKGNDYVGGLFGFIKAKSISLKGTNYIMVPISGNSHIGGLAGEIEETTFNIGTPLYGKSGTSISGLQINANSFVGGIVGNMKSSILKGTQSLYPTSGINHFDESKASIICTVNGNGDKVGGAVGCANDSEINGISVKANVFNNNGIYTGGVVGYFDDGNYAVTSCSFYGAVKGCDYTGGIVGEINKLGQITKCVNYGEISGGQKTGGIVGKIMNKVDEPWINECANVGDVTGVHVVGGIVGYISADGKEGNDWTKIARCGNYGNITASSGGDGCVGGIVGNCDSDKIRVNDCANHGTITGNGAFQGIGGIAGMLGKDATGLEEYDNVHVYNCANTGTIASDRSHGAHMGGIVGYMQEGKCLAEDSHVELCYNCGSVGPAKDATHGGIIGHCDYYVALEFCINYGDTHEKGESMIGTVVTAGVVYNNDLYHLSGTGDHSGHSWSSTSFTESQMGSLSTFENYSTNDWKVDKQLNMQGSGENSKSRVILTGCPFQNIVYK